MSDAACQNTLGSSDCEVPLVHISQFRDECGARDTQPHSDHATLWLDKDGKPTVYSMHVYTGNVLNYTPSKTVDPTQRQRNG